MNLKHIMLAGAMAFALAGTAQGQVSVPNTFTDGTPAVAADVNANFSALADAINDLAGRVDALENDSGGAAAGVPGVYRLVSTQSEFFGQNNQTVGYAEINAYVLQGQLEILSDGTWTLTGSEFEHRLGGIGDLSYDGEDPPNRLGSQLLEIQMSPEAVTLSGTWTQNDAIVTFTIGSDEILDFRVSLGGEVLLSANLARESDGFQSGQAGVVIAIKLANP